MLTQILNQSLLQLFLKGIKSLSQVLISLRYSLPLNTLTIQIIRATIIKTVED